MLQVLFLQRCNLFCHVILQLYLQHYLQKLSVNFSSENLVLPDAPMVYWDQHVLRSLLNGLKTDESENEVTPSNLGPRHDLGNSRDDREV